jgi:hypothetical protein
MKGATVEEFKVDRNVPVPEEPVTRKQLFPLEQLDVGESIEFPQEHRRYVQSTVSTLKRRKGLEFTVRKVTDTACRVWRIA